MRRVLLVGVALCCATTAQAGVIQITSGGISTGWGSPTPYFDVTVSLEGENFSYGDWEANGAFRFTLFPSVELESPVLVAPGQEIDLSGVTRLGVGHPASYGAEHYYLSGDLGLATSTVFASTLVTAPFTMSGQIRGLLLGVGTPLDLEVFGSGMMTAWLVERDGLLELSSLSYELMGEGVASREAPPAVPEPGTLALLALGLAGIGLRRR